MKLQVIVDNHTYIDQYFLGEPAVCFYIEDEEKKILFDAGYSEIVLSNAEKMHIDLSRLTHIVLSHGHDDHTRGLKFLKEKIDLSKTKLITHPDCLLPKRDGSIEIGCPLNETDIRKICSYQPSAEPVKITEHLTFLGEIPSIYAFEKRAPIGEVNKGSGWEEDLVMEDSALVYRSKKGLLIITGCSHSGICNIIDYAKKVCHNEHIYGIIGGFHLLKQDKRLDETVQTLSKMEIEQFYPCHCVSFEAKVQLNEAAKVCEVGVGLTIEL